MSDGSLLARARRPWTELAATPIAFPRTGISVVTSRDSRLCPPGWAGVVVLGGAGIATVPADELRPAVAALPVAQAIDADAVRARLAPAATLGPATLAYLDQREFAGAAAVEQLHAGHRDVGHLLASVSAADAGECGLDEITSPAHVVRDGPAVVAAAGYQLWPGSVAHLSVLTGDGHRGRGLARLVASAAVADALASGLLPQWRARPLPSRRVALRLGFRELGAQLSFRPAA